MRRLVLISLALAFTWLIAPKAARAEARPAPQLAPANAPKSEFAFRVGFTKDPFFPKSQDVPAPPLPGATNTVVRTISGGFEGIVLKGISQARGRPLAIINDSTVAEGEEFTPKRGTARPIVVRVVEIKENSVVVAIDGVTKELSLRRN